ncbi:MAG: type IV pilus biogenesis/stability protein PilW [Candidatus Parabeggiatoa sp. nov. 2]|nr:MAG: type IV pilus biogenesis/stability protein PilW [Beggiatoa sp. 4572_84]RKZ56437.1 MAG: type IV pilus biogenesis/stability protein PilW [Gammaproteobacteria bacterium]
MKRENLGRLCCLLWLVVNLLAACGGQKIQDNNYTPDNEAAKINLQLGVEYMRRGQNDIALNKLQKALILDNYYADAHNAIAVLYEHLGVDDEARRHYQTAVTLKPKGSDIHNNYGQFLCKHGQPEAAFQHFLKALEDPVYRFPETPYTNAGLCALRHKDSIKAETYFRQALQKNPKFPIALYHMAQLSYEQRGYNQARDYLQRYLKVAEHTPKTLWLGVRIARALNDRDAEASYALLLRRKFPDALETQKLYQSERH